MTRGESVLDCLTPRQREVCTLLADGYDLATIAGKLGIDAGRTRNISTDAGKRLGVSGSHAIAVLVLRERLARAMVDDAARHILALHHFDKYGAAYVRRGTVLAILEAVVVRGELAI